MYRVQICNLANPSQAKNQTMKNYPSCQVVTVIPRKSNQASHFLVRLVGGNDFHPFQPRVSHDPTGISPFSVIFHMVVTTSRVLLQEKFNTWQSCLIFTIPDVPKNVSGSKFLDVCFFLRIRFLLVSLTQPMDPWKKSLNFIFPTKYVIPKSLKFSHWPSKFNNQKTPQLFHFFGGGGFVRFFLKGKNLDELWRDRDLHNCWESFPTFGKISFKKIPLGGSPQGL